MKMAEEEKMLASRPPLLPPHYCHAIRNLLGMTLSSCVLGIFGGLMGTELRMRVSYAAVPPGPPSARPCGV